MAALLALAVSLYYRSSAFDADIASASVSELRLRIQRHPRDLRPPLELARRYLMEQRLPETAREIDRALRLDPQSPEALYLQGLLDYAEHREVQAIEHLEQVLKLKPAYPPARLHLGMIFVERSELKKSLEVLKQYVGEEPLDDAGYYWLGVVAFTSGYEKLGLWAMQRAVALAPEVATYHLALGGFYLSSRENRSLQAKAESELREAARLAPGDWMIHNRLAVAYLRGNRLRECAAELEEAVRLNPRAYEPRFLLPQLYRQLGDRKKAADAQRIAESLAKKAEAPRRQARGPAIFPAPHTQP